MSENTNTTSSAEPHFTNSTARKTIISNTLNQLNERLTFGSGHTSRITVDHTYELLQGLRDDIASGEKNYIIAQFESIIADLYHPDKILQHDEIRTVNKFCGGSYCRISHAIQDAIHRNQYTDLEVESAFWAETSPTLSYALNSIKQGLTRYNEAESTRNVGREATWAVPTKIQYE